jgi:tricorn protease
MNATSVRRPVLTLAVWISLTTAPALAQTKLLRFPDVHGDKVVFTYAGDLWIAPITGGTATRLTAHPGLELFAKFSPDGQWIAFTGQYDGDEQVYVIPVSGGVPKQLTFYPARGPLPERWGYDNQVYGWSPDGKRVLFRSLRDAWTLDVDRLYTVSAAGGPAEPLPMPVAGAGAFSPDGYSVVYSPVFRDFRSEKRYSGGEANVLWVFDLRTHKARQLTTGPRAERDPMWIGHTVYYNSDRDGHFNLYGRDVESGATTQLTHSTTWDVRWPSGDQGGRIVYEQDGELQLFDTRSGVAKKIEITVPDDGVASRPSRVSAANLVEGFALSPKGERALFVARGDVFTAPIENGPTRNLTHSSSAHDKHATWSPDGSKIAFISDASGEEEIYVAPQDGSVKADRVTTGGHAMRYAPVWAPDGRRLAFSDKDGKLSVVTLEDRRVTDVAADPRQPISDYAWSPRGNHLAFAMSEANGTSSVFVWSAADNKARRVTDSLFNEYAPAWDPDGTYLYYLSDRDYAPVLSGFGSPELNFVPSRTTGIFALALRRDVPNPVPPQSDEVTIGPAKDSAATKAGPQPTAGTTLTIDFDGLATRVTRVPVDADNISRLSAKKGQLLYLVEGTSYLGRDSDRKTALRIFAFADRKETTLVEDVQGYALSFDGTKVLVRQSGGFSLYDATPAGAASKKPVATAGLMVDRVPREEWAQIFDEVWRRYRDFFYVNNMHGYDWEGLRRQYRPLLAHVGHRSDLNYLISEMISELTVQHAYIVGGDWQAAPRPAVALPGARFALDSAVGRFRIARIFSGQNEEPQYRAPLTEVGVDAKVGDYVLAIDGEELRGDDDPYRLLRHKADRPVTLTLNSTPRLEGARRTTYRPLTRESDLIYLDWVTRNRRKVDSLTGGRVAYLHVPDMGDWGLREFIKWYYPQVRREGLIVDVRANGGGFVSQMLIERLRREVLAAFFFQTRAEPFTYPYPTFVGPMVTILDENSASDGDIFPAMFRQARLGPLVGKRSWGGAVGITDHGPLIDGGVVYVPEFGFASATGEWIIEGHGVDPDIVVENDPEAVLAGRDPQLERAVQEVLRLMAEHPRHLPRRPADPVKTK